MAKKPVVQPAKSKEPTSEISPALPEIAFFLDVESLNVVANAALPSIGCVVVDMARATPYDVADEIINCIADIPVSDTADGTSTTPAFSFYTNIDVTEQLVSYNRTMSNATQRWWGVAKKPAVDAVLAQPKSVCESLRYLVSFMRVQMEARTHNLSVADRKTVYENVSVYARGTHFDVASIETLMFDVLGILPATSAHTAFNGALWFYRSPRDSRSYVDGLKNGIKTCLDAEGFDSMSRHVNNNCKEMQKHLNSRLADQTGNPDYLSGAAHHPIYDVFYDYLMVYNWQNPDHEFEKTA